MDAVRKNLCFECVNGKSQSKKSQKDKTVKTRAKRYPQTNLGACLVPWTKDYKLDTVVFEEHIQETIDSGYKSFYIFGTASEGYAVDDDLFSEIVQVFAAKSVNPGFDPAVCTISTSMRQMIKRIQLSYDMGIRMFQLTLPCWGRLDDQELLLFFKTVCGEFSDCRFLHYNEMLSKRILNASDYRRIVDEVPNLVATKFSSFDYRATKSLITETPELQHFLLENNYALGCTVGECSLLNSFDILCPKTTLEFYEAGQRTDLPEVFRLAQLFLQMETDIFSHCKREMIDAGYDKVIAWLHNPRFSPRLLAPYIGMTDEELDISRRVYEEKYQNVE